MSLNQDPACQDLRRRLEKAEQEARHGKLERFGLHRTLRKQARLARERELPSQLLVQPRACVSGFQQAAEKRSDETCRASSPDANSTP